MFALLPIIYSVQFFLRFASSFLFSFSLSPISFDFLPVFSNLPGKIISLYFACLFKELIINCLIFILYLFCCGQIIKLCLKNWLYKTMLIRISICWSASNRGNWIAELLTIKAWNSISFSDLKFRFLLWKHFYSKWYSTNSAVLPLW